MAKTSSAFTARETRASRLRREANERRWRADEATKRVAHVRKQVERGRRKKRAKHDLDAPAPKLLQRSLAQSSATLERAVGDKRVVFRRPDKPIPKFANDDGRTPVVDIEPVGGVIHGVDIQYLNGILDDEEILSTFARTGKVIPDEGDAKGNKRKKDQIRGGSTAVFTRAFGREQIAFKASGYGVGASTMPKPGQSPGTLKVQLVMSGEVLQREGVRAGSFDFHGGISGAPDSYLNKTKGDFDKVYGAWGMQSRGGYNAAIKASVTGEVKDHNEQLHYLAMPCKGVLRGIVCTSQEAFDEVMRERKGTVNNDPNVPYAGTVRMGDVDVPVVLADGEGSMVRQLQAAGIANEKGQVR